ncbi:ABC transporter substrate-binding protein [Hahella sp. HN01]|uniref:substrate-binding periplasmic protein n=1 Tax=Hahella sp. HN01 TaxID=2847262 RepID=UPI001C1F09FF|nr:transporter substrate-binding domain-containing protein [Hahella sp. HN01]MBU6955746.1 transporter substrate-binding domain-containing protein [Hahella sp. HN01]
MKRIILFAALMLGFVGFAAAQSVTLLMDEAYPPYSYAENGKTKGIYVDIIMEAAKLTPDYTITLKPLPWKRALAQMESGEEFALFPPYYRPEDRPWMDYSIPLLTETVAMFVTQDMASKKQMSKWPDDFKGMRVGLQSGYATLSDEEKAMFTMSQASDIVANLKKMASGRIDAHPNDKLSVLWTLENNRSDPTLKDLKIEPAAVISEEVAYLAFSNTKNQSFPYREDFISKMKAAVEQLKQSGKLQEIIDSWTK